MKLLDKKRVKDHRPWWLPGGQPTNELGNFTFANWWATHDYETEPYIASSLPALSAPIRVPVCEMTSSGHRCMRTVQDHRIHRCHCGQMTWAV